MTTNDNPSPTKRDNEVFWIMNRERKTAELLDRDHFPYWEAVQWAFRCGFQMSDGASANAIGRCKDLATFERKARFSGVKILSYT